MGAIEQVDRIKRELAQLDLEQSSCPVDRLRAKKQAEQKAQDAHGAKQQQQTANWVRWIDQRIAQHLQRYFGSGDEKHPGALIDAIGCVMAENRKHAEKQLKAGLEEERRAFDAKLAEVEQRCKAVPGKLPVVKAWRPEAVVYASEMVAYNSATYQAKRDTAQRPGPGGSDWTLIARNGRDAITPSLRGTFDTHECYAQLDVVEFEGSSFIAQRDNPGIPGNDDGWQVFGSERMDRRAEVEAAIEEERQSVDAKLEALEQASNDRWAVIDQRIERAREYVLQGTGEVLGQFRDELKEFKRALEDEERAFEAKLAALEERLKSVPGRLPVAKTWQLESVIYQAEMVAHNGALYQACKDTAQTPGGSDWVCVARHGRDAITPNLRGTFDTHECYAQLDVVEFEGASYIAKRDDPGLPGHDDGWQVLSKCGQRGRRGEAIRGPQGEKGAKGDNGNDALEIVNWHIDPVNYRVVPFTAGSRESR